MRIDIQVKGIDGIMATLGTLGAHGAAVTGQGLTMWAEMVMRDSKQNYVPVDTGALRASGFVSGEGGVSGGGNVKVAASDIATRKTITVEQAFVATPTQAALSGRTQTSVILGYGGASAPYALSVHENPRSGKTGGVSPSGRKYKRWARVGEWKFLETPVKKHMGRVGFYIARALDRAIAQARRAG